MAFLLLFYTGTFIAYAVLSIPRQGQSALQSILSVDTARDIPLGITQGAVNVASDFYIFCLPIPVVWKLQLPPQRKLGMLATFMTGLLVVELTVGIMCSCLPSFPGFFRYHLPQLRALLSLFNTSLKYLHVPFSKHGQSSSSTSSNAKRLATRDIKITLGSRVDGKGLFLNPNSVFAAEQDGEAHHLSNFDTRSDATRREYYEQPEVPQPEPCHDEQHSSQGNTWGSSKDSTIEGPQRDVEPSSPDRPRWWKRSFSSRYGYWDITSFFGTRGTEGSLPSKMHSESKDSKDRKG
ncbi:hypothetical protein MMC28_006181 [Mycoblastus sanguinarius]|nr:hypothetical protein [Mycoblastus sanguinarius]